MRLEFVSWRFEPSRNNLAPLRFRARNINPYVCGRSQPLLRDRAHKLSLWLTEFVGDEDDGDLRYSHRVHGRSSQSEVASRAKPCPGETTDHGPPDNTLHNTLHALAALCARQRPSRGEDCEIDQPSVSTEAVALMRAVAVLARYR
jgi:hypothetical protein